MKEEQVRVSADIQLLISNLIAHARHVDSPFPMKAMMHRTNVEKLKNELLVRIGKLEQTK